jgi:hypothetical protein
MLITLSSIESTQAKPTKETMNNTKLFLDYAASHQDAIITYQASNMVLVVHSNTSYLSKLKAQKLRRRPFFHVNRHQGPRKQWCCTQHCPAHQSSHVFSGRSKTRCTLHQCTQGSPTTPTSQRNGTPATTNSDTNQQQAALGVVNSNIQPR